MKNSVNRIGLLLSCAFVVIFALGGGVIPSVLQARATAVPVGKKPSVSRLIALPRLLAAGSKEHLWLAVPAPRIKPTSEPQFLLLSHALNARHGNAALWRQISAGGFTGIPLCAVATENPDSGALKHGIYLFFQHGYSTCFGRKESISLPTEPGDFSPVAAAGQNGNVYLLAYGTAAPAKKTRVSPVQRILAHVEALAGGLTASTEPAVRPTATLPAEMNTQKKAVADLGIPSPSLVAGTRAGKPRNSPTSTPAPPPTWHFLQLHDHHWSLLPTPALPVAFSNSLIVGHVVLMAINHQLILFHLTAGHILSVQAMNIYAAHPAWHPLPAVSLPLAAHEILGAQLGRQGVVAWTSSGVAGRTNISALRVGASAGGKIQLTPWAKPLVTAIVSSTFSDIAMGRDGDCFAFVLHEQGQKLIQYTFNVAGKLLQGPENIIPLAKSPPVPGAYERLIFAALIVLLALSVWRRKEPFGSLKVSDEFKVARLYRRFGAAAIDLVLSALIIMLVFHLYTRQDWVKIAGASLDLLFNPQKLLQAPQFLWLLAIYEIHVTVAELIFARSLGKWILGLRVVDLTGQRPGFVALLTRNLFRIPEMIAIVVLVFMFVSTDRQRIGDILARTVVVQGHDG